MIFQIPHNGSPNPQTDNTTDHFVVIVGMGSDVNGDYFTFYDNASGRKPFASYGASSENKLYYYSSLNMIKGSSNTYYFEHYTDGYYIGNF